MTRDVRPGRTRALLAVLVAATMLLLPGLPGSSAAFTDAASFQTGTFRPGTIAPISGIDCDGGAPLSGSVVISWTAPAATATAQFRIQAIKTSGNQPGQVLFTTTAPGTATRYTLTRDQIPEATSDDQLGFFYRYYRYRVEITVLHPSGWTSDAVARAGQERHNNRTGHNCS